MVDITKILFSYSNYFQFTNYNLLSRFNSLDALHRYLLNSGIIKENYSIFEKAKEQVLKLNELKIQIVDYYNPNYPKLLKEISKPPVILFCKGNLDLLNYEYIGIVGTRKPSSITKYATIQLIEKISSNPKMGIVSGMANGIDRVAMFNSISKNIPTIGVLGTGLEKEYPKENRDLYNLMNESNFGLLISEMKIDDPIGKWSFPKRNRIISGISKILFLMEAPLKSGAISSATHAIEQNRDLVVFFDERQIFNEGGKKFISEGATKITLQEITKEKNFFHISEILSESYSDSPYLFARLSQLESEGLIQSLGGGYYTYLK